MPASAGTGTVRGPKVNVPLPETVTLPEMNDTAGTLARAQVCTLPSVPCARITNSHTSRAAPWPAGEPAT